VWLLSRRRGTTGTDPDSLANSMVRSPERMLLVLPAVLRSVPAEDQHRFLQHILCALSRIGEFQVRRKFLALFAEVVRRPSRESARQFTAFLFSDCPAEFRDALNGDGKCASAMEFLKVAHYMITSLEKNRYVRERKSLPTLDELPEIENACDSLPDETERQMACEWYILLEKLHKALPDKIRRGNRDRRRQPQGRGFAQAARSRKRGDEIKHARHLPWFDSIADELCAQCNTQLNR
jgi:hypothetical protein